jgi:hypothetical protein
MVAVSVGVEIPHPVAKVLRITAGVTEMVGHFGLLLPLDRG